MYPECIPLDPTGSIEVNGIIESIKSKDIGTIVLELEDNNGKIHKLTFETSLLFLWFNQDLHP